MRVERPFAYCCAEGGGRVEHCDCVNKNHGTALFDATPTQAPTDALVGRLSAAANRLARDPAYFEFTNPIVDAINVISSLRPPPANAELVERLERAATNVERVRMTGIAEHLYGGEHLEIRDAIAALRRGGVE